MKKRLLSILLALIMVVSILPITALADVITEISTFAVKSLPSVKAGDTAGNISYSFNSEVVGKFKISTKWATDHSDFEGTFEVGEPYYAVLELTAKDGVRFASNTTVSSVNRGTLTSVVVSDDQTKCTVRVRLITPTESHITLNTNGGTINSGNVEKYTVGVGTTLPTDVTRTGYDFGGWYAAENLTGTAVAEIGTDDMGNKKFWAKWTATNYDITYNLDGGTNASGNPENYTIETDTITLADPEKTGYTFGGWFAEDGTQVTEIAKGSTGNKELYADWTAIEYNIAYDLNGATTAPNNPTKYTIEDTVTLLAPAKTGHNFDGWTWPGQTEPEKNVSFSGSTGDKEYAANWTVNQYTISFANTGDTVIGPITQDYSTDVDAPEDPTKAGYTFIGWDKEIPATMPAEDMEITAQWEINKYSITVKASENGTVTADKAIAIEGEPVTLTITPDDGYEVESVSYSYGTEEKTVTAVDDLYSFTMPAANVEVSAVFAKAQDGFIFLPVIPGEVNPFVDVKTGDWFYDAVMDVYGKSLMTGLEWNKFAPHNQITRAQIVTILWRLEGCPMGTEESGFFDVTRNSWYSYAVDWAAAFDIVEGYSETSFGPNDLITREQFAAILYRYAKYAGYDVWSCQTELTGFVDAASVSDYAVDPMQWAVGAGLMEGTNFQLMPQGTATRAQAAAILSRFLG